MTDTTTTDTTTIDTSSTDSTHTTDTMAPQSAVHDGARIGALPDGGRPYVLQRDEGVHHHFLDNLATTKISAEDGGSMSVVEFVAPEGFGPPLHRHEHEDEMMVLLEGEVAVRSGDTETIARPGATIHLPHGVPHSFQVLSGDARMVTVTASLVGRPRFAEMVDALGRRVDDPVMPSPMDIDPGQVAEVCAAHGITVLGPPPAPLG